MAKLKNGFDITALRKYADALDEVGGSGAIMRAAERGMKSTKLKVNQRVSTLVQKPNMPAGGKYSVGGTMAHLNKDFKVKWEGNDAYIKLGFNLEGDGLASIFLMYGTPHHAPLKGLREALKEDPKKISRKEMEKACKTVLERLGG